MLLRATPHEWMRYTSANIAINLYLQGDLGPCAQPEVDNSGIS